MIKRPTKVIFIKNKILFKIDDVDFNKTLVSKNNLLVKKAHLNTLLDIMIMITLDDYT